MALEFDLGFFGGGQLARMSIQAAQSMGLRCMSIDPDEDSPASQIAVAIRAPLNDAEALSHAIASSRRMALENEFIPARIIREAYQKAKRDENELKPGIDSLATIQDKLLQRQALAHADVPGPHFAPIDDDGVGAIARVGFPMVLKSRFGGYDGHGIRVARNAEDFENYRIMWESSRWLAEEMLDFKRELAVMVYRTPEAARALPTMETVQSRHVCDLVFPAEIDASEIAIAAVEAVKGFGLFGVELFEAKDGRLLVNEIAPRPHNSGHYSLDWGGISQFEQHVRLALDIAVDDRIGASTCMANLIGLERVGDWRFGLAAALAKEPGARFHWYGKTEVRAGRKMGHINVCGNDIIERAKAARETFMGAWARLPTGP